MDAKGEKSVPLDTPPSALEPHASDLGETHTGDNSDGLHRRLNNRQIQLVAIGGSIGTALFVSIGGALRTAGPGSLLIAWTLYCCVMGLVNNAIAEMTVFMPVSGGFVRLAGQWVDEALGFMVGWNFFIYEALLIPFEITALNLVLGFWNSRVTEPGPTAGVCAAVIVCYAALNLFAVRAYGEAEFWLSGGKVILIFILFFFTFITMVGGNPEGDAYGFRHWRDPGAFASSSRSSGSLAEFEGFLTALWSALFAIVGPEYISMVAAEAQRPSIYIKTAFKTVYIRFGLFFMGSALAVGIVLPYNDPTLDAVNNGGEGGGTAAASPYVIAMNNLGVDVLPHIVNFLMFTSIFSAGNTYTYCATRTLYGLALEGRAPAILRKCNSRGVPIYAFIVVMLFPFLSFLQVGESSSIVITWFVSLITAGALIDFMVMCITFLFYYRACQVQGLDRRTQPYYGYFQPYGTWIALAVLTVGCLCYGYTSLSPWDVELFFQNYTMQILAPILYFGWKLVKKTKIRKPEEIDLVWERPIIDRYENSLTTPPDSFWAEMGRLVGIGRKRKSKREEA